MEQKNVYFPPTTPIVGKDEKKNENGKVKGYTNFCTVWQMTNDETKKSNEKEKIASVL